MLKKIIAAAALAMSLSPAVQAEARNTGVGEAIAAHGNQALLVIRSEFKNAARHWIPVAPAKPARAKVRIAGPAAAPAAVRSAS